MGNEICKFASHVEKNLRRFRFFFHVQYIKKIFLFEDRWEKEYEKEYYEERLKDKNDNRIKKKEKLGEGEREV